MKKRTSSKNWMVIIILVVAGILAWHYSIWQYFETSQPEKAELPERQTSELSEEKKDLSRLTMASLEAAEYYFPIYERKTRLIAGQHQEEEVIDKDNYRYFFSAGIVENKVAFGDLNNNGKEDAVVIVFSTGGGSGVFYELAVVMNQNGNPYYLTSEYLGDRVRVNSLDIKDGIIIVNMLIHDVDDAACCPTLYKVFQYKLSGNELVEI